MTLSSAASSGILHEESNKPKPMARDGALGLSSAPERHPSKKVSSPDLSGFVGGEDLWMVGKYER